MPLTAEQVRQRWNPTLTPIAFDPKAVNFTDLRVVDLQPTLDPLMAAIGFEPISGEQLPAISAYTDAQFLSLFGVKNFRELDPETQQQLLKSKSRGVVSGQEMMEVGMSSTWAAPAIPFFDPEDQLFYAQSGKTVSDGTYIGLRHERDLQSGKWKVEMPLQMDTMVSIPLPLSRQMAISLVPPQKVRNEISAMDGRIGYLSRAVLSSDNPRRYTPQWVENILLHSGFVNFSRQGDYPIPEEKKADVITGLCQVIQRNVQLDMNYRMQLLGLYELSIAQGIDLVRALAAREA